MKIPKAVEPSSCYDLVNGLYLFSRLSEELALEYISLKPRLVYPLAAGRRGEQ